ncbi:helix-turn-helix domain-containing protein [Puia dinghuensis]|uniref:HTH araC/xylS-type domain-containing protein n=1 Tax=Puia dinghuensis TaxID=1792502 RepID=A0A8J2UE98_9BACT|nr:AraC family transcriptional regulator [Puia dinghuensis]GGB03301.1 hypothetical protein GCM10011511_28210 [Puia dinghuensis]
MNRGNTIAIPDRLKPFVRAVWYIDGAADNAFPNYADGTPGIVFQQRDTGVFDCDNPAKIPGGYIFGQTVKPVVLNAPKNCIIIGIVLYPHVLQSLFRFNASEITDDFVDLQLLSDIPRIDLYDQLWSTNNPQQQLNLIFRYLEALIKKNSAEPDKGLQYAVSRIMQGKERVSFKKIHTELNLSERTFERKFEQHVGVSPRLLANIAQFQTSLKQLKGGKYHHLSDIAYENGYSDQSHFIRSFKKFTGVSPLQFVKQLSESFYF